MIPVISIIFTSLSQNKGKHYSLPFIFPTLVSVTSSNTD
nr:MAG TPA: hypothetical protein [Caudoviricetes sp.]